MVFLNTYFFYFKLKICLVCQGPFIVQVDIICIKQTADLDTVPNFPDWQWKCWIYRVPILGVYNTQANIQPLYRVTCTSSRPITVVEQRREWIVTRWVTIEDSEILPTWDWLSGTSQPCEVKLVESSLNGV